MVNDKYSHKDFTGRTLLDVDPKQLNGTEIHGSCFYQEWQGENWLRREIFPNGMTGVTFVGCNLDNVLVPDGCVMLDCKNRVIRLQNDLDDWLCDEDARPTQPVNWKLHEKLGLSVDPKDIPQEFIREQELDEVVFLVKQATGDFGGAFDESPRIKEVKTLAQVSTFPAADWEKKSKLDQDMLLSKSSDPPEINISKGMTIVKYTVRRVTISGRGPLFVNGRMPPQTNRSRLQKAMGGN